MFLPGLYIIIGFILLIKGADWMVGGATALAKRKNISDLAIGLTVVAFGTSAPELVVNVVASYQNYPDIVFGNVIGSNNFNLFIILGVVGIILPVSVQSSTVWIEIPISFLAALIIWILANNFFLVSHPVLSRFDGIILLFLFILFLFYIYRQMKKDVSIQTKSVDNKSLFTIWGLIALGLTGLVAGGKIVVNNAVEIAQLAGLSEKIIGLTIIAAGTSLPELVTSLVAALKKNSDIAIGNIIGSNIFNILLIISLSAIIHPVNYNPAFNTDLYLLLGGTGFIFIAMFTGKKKKLDRWEAGVLLATFVLYTIYLVSKEN
ncbi:MAG: calcium/sodium antiporter [Bacteroidales bacterium]|nr:calcium/sodium antiporter [Bacteroidales bacterium]